MSNWGTKTCADCGQTIEAGVTGSGKLFWRDHECSGEGDRPAEPHPFERAPIGLECRRCGGGIDNPIHSGEGDRG